MCVRVTHEDTDGIELVLTQKFQVILYAVGMEARRRLRDPAFAAQPVDALQMQPIAVDIQLAAHNLYVQHAGLKVDTISDWIRPRRKWWRLRSWRWWRQPHAATLLTATEASFIKARPRTAPIAASRPKVWMRRRAGVEEAAVDIVQDDKRLRAVRR